MTTPSSGNATSPMPGTLPSGVPAVVTAAIFKVESDQISGIAYFSELTGIQSEVESTEYIAAGPFGQTSAVLHTKQFGKTKPPTVTLKRGVDGGGAIWKWHLAARKGLDTARSACTSLTIMDASGADRGTYHLYNCWPTKLDISGAKAGAGEVVYETVTLVCDEIAYTDGGGTDVPLPSATNPSPST